MGRLAAILPGVVTSIAGMCMLSYMDIAAGAPGAPTRLCIDDKCPEASPLTKSIKWHPGHGLKTQGYGTADILRQLSKVNDSPHITFAKIHYQWGALETSQGIYDLSAIQSHYDYLAARGKRLIITIDDKKFATSDPSGVVPAYLSSQVSPSNNGFTAAIWRVSVMDRYIALMDAIAKEFDNKPYFEGIATQESVPSFGGVVRPPDYSPEDLAKQRNRLVVAMAKSFAHTNVFAWVNFLDGLEDEMVAHAFAADVGTGGPDVFRAKATTGQDVMYGIIGGVDYRGKMPLHFVASTPSFDYGTAREVFDYSIRNKTTHLAWVSTDSTVSWSSILTVLGAENGQIYSSCPTNYTGACDTK